jgi:hypothetical protein
MPVIVPPTNIAEGFRAAVLLAVAAATAAEAAAVAKNWKA